MKIFEDKFCIIILIVKSLTSKQEKKKRKKTCDFPFRKTKRKKK